MDQEEFVIFAELNRDYFDAILRALAKHFKHIEHGRQGDDYIWIHFGEEKIEIDSFYSMNLEVKSKRSQYSSAMQILEALEPNWFLQTFTPPKIDTTR